MVFKKIRDPYTIIYVIECEQGPIGHVRFEINDEQYVISYLLGRAFRGIKLGKKVLQIAIDSFKKSKISFLKAEVKYDNIASAINFLRLGFNEQSCGVDKRVFELDLREFKNR